MKTDIIKVVLLFRFPTFENVPLCGSALSIFSVQVLQSSWAAWSSFNCPSTSVSIHGGLYRWKNSFPFFKNQKLKEILIKYSKIILTASKDRLISKMVCYCKFDANFLTFFGLYHLLFYLETIGVTL